MPSDLELDDMETPTPVGVYEELPAADLELAGRMAGGFCRRNGVPRHEWPDYRQQALLTAWLESGRWDPSRDVPLHAYLAQRIAWRLVDLQRELFHEREHSLEEHLERGYAPTVTDDDAHAWLEDADIVADFLAWLWSAYPHRADILQRYMRLGSQKAVGQEMGLTTGTIGVTLWSVWKLAGAYKKDRVDLS